MPCAVGFPLYLSKISCSIEPEFTPILIGIFLFLQAFTTASTLSLPPIFPGFILSLSTPDSIAVSAIL